MNACKRVPAVLVRAVLGGVVGLALLGSSNEASGQQIHGAAHEPTPRSDAAQLSDTLTLTINGASMQLSLRDLEALPRTTLRVHNTHTNVDESYSGVAMSDLLVKAALPFKGNEQRFLHSYLRAQGTDRYFVLYSGAEIESAMHNGDVIVALSKDGHTLGEDGRLKLVTSEDKRPARDVRNLTALTLITVN